MKTKLEKLIKIANGFYSTMEAINQHQGYLFTQPLHNFIRDIEEIKAIPPETCANCIHFEKEGDTNGIYMTCNSDEGLRVIHFEDEDYCSKFEGIK